MPSSSTASTTPPTASVGPSSSVTAGGACPGVSPPAGAGNQAQLDALGLGPTASDEVTTGVVIAEMLDYLPPRQAVALALGRLEHPEVRAWIGSWSMGKLAATDGDAFLGFVDHVLPDGRGYELAAGGKAAELVGGQASGKIGVERTGEVATLATEVSAAAILTGGLGPEAKAELGKRLGGESEASLGASLGDKVACTWRFPLASVAVGGGVRALVQGFWAGDPVAAGLAPLVDAAVGMFPHKLPDSFVYAREAGASGEVGAAWGDPALGGSGATLAGEAKGATEGGYDEQGAFVGFAVSASGRLSGDVGLGDIGLSALSKLSFTALVKLGASLSGRLYLPADAGGQLTEGVLPSCRVVITTTHERPMDDLYAAVAQGVGVRAGETLTFGSWGAFVAWMTVKDAEAARMEGGTASWDPAVCSTEDGPPALIPEVSLERSWTASAPTTFGVASTLEKLHASVPGLKDSSATGRYTTTFAIEGKVRADARVVLPLLFGPGGFRARPGEEEAVALDVLRDLLAIVESGRVAGASVEGRAAAAALATIGLGDLHAIVTQELTAGVGGSLGHGAKLTGEVSATGKMTQKVPLPSQPWREVVAGLAG